MKPAGAPKISLAKLFSQLDSGPHGLTDKQAIKRSKVYGSNELSKKKKINPLIQFLRYFKSPMIIILLVAAVISGLTYQKRSFFVIIAMVFLSVILNFYQERKSNKAAEKIAKKLATRAAVLRNGKRVEILTKYIVPGDVVYLAAGDIVPADGQLIEADDFFVNESALTGESFPVEKTVARSNNLFSGTNVVSGYATMLIVKTGQNTEYGKIAADTIAPEEITPFEKGIKSFGYLIIKVIVFIVLVIFLINAINHKDLLESLIFSLAVAVGITPELLPMIMSVNMAKGSIRMAEKGVVVKRLSSIPDFGSMDVLCTDKTGTLTEDRITLIKHLDVAGKDNAEVLKIAYVNGALETGIKSLLDKAILAYKKFDIKEYKKIDEIPYDFLRRRSSIIYQRGASRHMVTKGAPEEIFKICTHYLRGKQKLHLTADKLKKVNQLYENLSNDGLRVLAIATKEVGGGKRNYPKTEEHEMTLEGFIAFYDPPKKSAKETLIFMKQHGVEIKILTGDSPLVTKKICTEIGLEIKGIVSGEELDINALSEETLGNKVMAANIIARLSPSQKERIISALKARGLVVGYLGDGINDAPALRNADVGISVDTAVDVAKETADIILMKKGLQELMDGVLEGRKTFGNTMKYLMMGLSSNFGNMFSMIAAVIFLPFFPMLPGQILLNNFLYDVSQISIPSDNVDDEYLQKPKHWDMKFIRNFMYTFGPISSIFDCLTFFVLFSVFHLTEPIFQAGWFIESLATQTLVIYVIRTRKIPFFQSSPSKYLVLSTLGAVIIGIVLTNPFFGNYFGFAPLPPKILLVILIMVIAYLLLVEATKQIFYRKFYKTSRI